MNKILKDDLLEIIKEYKKLSNFIEDEVPYKYAEDIREELFINHYLEQVEERIKNAVIHEGEVKS